MIRARAQVDRREWCLALEGHATGSPAVCAAVSALVYTLAGWLYRRQAPGLECRLAPGDALVRCRRGQVSDSAFPVVLEGLERLGESFPRFLEMRGPDSGKE